MGVEVQKAETEAQGYRDGGVVSPFAQADAEVA